MSEEYKDEVAAAEEFLRIFSDVERKELLKRLLKPFLKGFKKGYRFKDFESGYILGRVTVNDIIDLREQAFAKIKQALENVLTTQDQTEKAELLGYAFGTFLRHIEDTLSSKTYRELADERWYQIVLKNSRDMAVLLKRINKSVKHKFIVNRITRIAKKHAGELNKRQKEAIATIAAIFDK